MRLSNCEAAYGPDHHADASPRHQSRRRALRIEWYDQVVPLQHEWAVEDIIPIEGLVALYGESGAGKSFVALDWALRIASGMPVMGAATERQGVAYIAAEGANGIRKRVAAWQKHHDVRAALPFALIGESVDFRTASSADLEAVIRALREAAADFGKAGARLGVVIVDTLASVTPGAAETTSEGMGAAIYALRKLGEELGAVVIFVHHTGHSDTHRMRGWSGLLAAVDTSIEVARRGEKRVIRLRKQKDGDDERLLGAMRLQSVAIGNGDGPTLQGAVVEYSDIDLSETVSQGSAQKPAEKRMLSAIERALQQFGIAPPVPEIGPPVQLCVRRSRVVDEFYMDSMGGDGPVHPRSAAQRQEVARLIASLIAQGRVEQHQVTTREAYIWLKCAV